MAVSEIIGIDCATQPDRVGLALAKRDGDAWVFESVCTGSTRRLPVDIVARWICSVAGPCCWHSMPPLGLAGCTGKTLIAHLAGAPRWQRRRIGCFAEKLIGQLGGSQASSRLMWARGGLLGPRIGLWHS